MTDRNHAIRHLPVLGTETFRVLLQNCFFLAYFYFRAIRWLLLRIKLRNFFLEKNGEIFVNFMLW